MQCTVCEMRDFKLKRRAQSLLELSPLSPELDVSRELDDQRSGDDNYNRKDPWRSTAGDIGVLRHPRPSPLDQWDEELLPPQNSANTWVFLNPLKDIKILSVEGKLPNLQSIPEDRRWTPMPFQFQSISIIVYILVIIDHSCFATCRSLIDITIIPNLLRYVFERKKKFYPACVQQIEVCDNKVRH